MAQVIENIGIISEIHFLIIHTLSIYFCSMFIVTYYLEIGPAYLFTFSPQIPTLLPSMMALYIL